MTNAELLTLLNAVSSGATTAELALEQLARSNGGDAGYMETETAMVDTNREERRGFPEVIYCESKTAVDIIGIATALLETGGLAYGTRCVPDVARQVLAAIPNGQYDGLSRTLRIGPCRPQRTGLVTAVIAAGTSDRPVAEEACKTLETFGAPVERIYDVGVAGLHRLLAQQDKLRNADVLIVVAGMEGALPSVVGGFSRQPVIAVPTSVGYGTALGGFTALFGMLTSCASGITVVNIDNGFGAAMAALAIVDAIERHSVERVKGNAALNEDVK